MKRGRPPKDASDIELVSAVRAAKARGSTVTEACDAIAGRWSESERLQRGYSTGREDCAWQLQKRYVQFQREYHPWEPWGHPRLLIMRRAMGFAPVWVRQRASAMILLRGRPHRKGKI